MNVIWGVLAAAAGFAAWLGATSLRVPQSEAIPFGIMVAITAFVVFKFFNGNRHQGL